jgi:hypothetical protein
MKTVQIGNWLVSADSETFRIFPRNRRGETIPVTRINHFLYLRCTLSGMLVTFKRYLHQGAWFWRDSRDRTWAFEADVIAEVARMLFRGDEGKARDLLLAVLVGGDLPYGQLLAA